MDNKLLNDCLSVSSGESTPTSANPAPEALLAQEDFVRALVRNLLHGADGEDDILQHTWLRALRRPPTDGARGRSWLACVAQNLVRDRARDNRRRREREQDARKQPGHEHMAGRLSSDDATTTSSLRVRRGMHSTTGTRSCRGRSVFASPDGSGHRALWIARAV